MPNSSTGSNTTSMRDDETCEVVIHAVGATRAEVIADAKRQAAAFLDVEADDARLTTNSFTAHADITAVNGTVTRYKASVRVRLVPLPDADTGSNEFVAALGLVGPPAPVGSVVVPLRRVEAGFPGSHARPVGPVVDDVDEDGFDEDEDGFDDDEPVS